MYIHTYVCIYIYMYIHAFEASNHTAKAWEYWSSCSDRWSGPDLRLMVFRISRPKVSFEKFRG